MRCALVVLAIAAAFPLHAQDASRDMSHTMTENSELLAHVTNSFHLTVAASMEEAAPLFGPNGERAWAGEEWDPKFLFPVPAKDVEGAVFTIQHGEHTIVWINTLFDVQAGRIQYVYLIPGLLATTIDLRLHAIDTTHTRVDVTYVRTALRLEANAHVETMGEHDREQGKVWEDQIAGYLRRRVGHP